MRYVLYDVIFHYTGSDKRETSVFTYDEFAGSSATEQWYNKYPHTVVIEIHPVPA